MPLLTEVDRLRLLSIYIPGAAVHSLPLQGMLYDFNCHRAVNMLPEVDARMFGKMLKEAFPGVRPKKVQRNNVIKTVCKNAGTSGLYQR